MSDTERILLVEDEETLAIGIEFNLSAEGFLVDMADDGRKALQYFESQKYDLIILDIMLPYVDGFEIARQVREKDIQVPILFLTARTGMKDRIKGLELGADDYLTKPFHLDELLLRVKGMLKRKHWYQSPGKETPALQFGNNMINFDNFICKAGEKEIHLTSHEAMLLHYLSLNPDKIISRQELLREVWNINSDIETRTVDNFIMRLRKYFEPDPNKPVYIKSVRGKGYMFCKEKD